MDIGQLLVIVAVLGLVWFLVTKYIPMPPGVKTVLTAIAVLLLCLLLLDWAGLTHIRLSR